MTFETFVDKLVERHESSYKKNPALLTDIKAVLKDAPDYALDSLWEYYCKNWDKDYSPKSAWFYANLQIDNSRGVVYYNKCDKCGKVYSFSGRCCPSCKGPYRSIIAGSKATEHTDMQEDCGFCERFGRQRCYGPSCNSFGEQMKADEVCRDCICRPCCSQAMSAKDNPSKYFSDVREGKINAGYLKV
jgi:hypothetical protein